MKLIIDVVIMKISVCIPAYNRAALLPELLDSIFSQGKIDFDVIICEDNSNEREDIRKVAEYYSTNFPGKLIYHENELNLGYDGNLRRLIELATGDYVLFMGNDDLMATGALALVSDAVETHPDVGVVLRSYSSFRSNPKEPEQIFRYFDDNRFFEAGSEAVVTFFRRCVFISGMVVHRESAQNLATDEFDGSLLYQQYLVGRILAQRNGVYIVDILSHHRLGGVPEFGNSVVERNRFIPGEQTPDSSLHFIRGMLLIALDIEKKLDIPVYKSILQDIGNYSYPILSIQSKRSKVDFLNYVRKLAELGFWRVPLFYCYSFSLLLFGPRICDLVIAEIKRRLGRAPLFGNIHQGTR